MKIRVHKIASVVYRAGFQKDVEVTDQLEVKAGNALVVRALREKRVYSDLELENGRMAKIFRGDIFIGALGRRRALRGFCGELPTSLRVGDRVQLLNRGGVLGSSSTQHMDFGEPVSCEVLGMPIRSGRIVSLADDPIARQESLAGLNLPPVLAVSGTCMNSGGRSVDYEFRQAVRVRVVLGLVHDAHEVVEANGPTLADALVSVGIAGVRHLEDSSSYAQGKTIVLVRIGADDRDKDIIPLFGPAEQSCRLGAARQGAIHHGKGVFEELHVGVEVGAPKSPRRRAGCGRRAG